MPPTLSQLIWDLPYQKTQGNLEVVIEGLSYDSRKVNPGDLFFALCGKNEDGHRYIPSAIEKGAKAILCEKKGPSKENVPTIWVPDSRIALGEISSRFFSDPSKDLEVLGLTGTNGKTTLSFLCEEILKKSQISVGVTGTINCRFGNTSIPSLLTTPESLDYHALLEKMKGQGVTHVISEISSHSLEMKRCEGVSFKGAVFTNLSRDHLEFHETMEKYYLAKSKLFNHYLRQSKKKNPWAVVNIDDVYGKRLQKEYQGKLLTYALENTEADFFAKDSKFSSKGFEAKIQTPKGEISLETHLLGQHNLSNCLAALAVAEAWGMENSLAIEALSHLKRIPGRLDSVPNQQGKTVLIDYAHTPDALEKVLLALQPLVMNGGKLRCLFGCGGDRDSGKRSIMGELACVHADWVMITSDNPRTEDPRKIIEDILKGIPSSFKEFQVEIDRKKAIQKALSKTSQRDILLIAGKGHEDYQILGKERIEFDDFKISQKILQGNL